MSQFRGKMWSKLDTESLWGCFSFVASSNANLGGDAGGHRGGGEINYGFNLFEKTSIYKMPQGN